MDEFTGAGGYEIESAASGESLSRRDLLGKGRIGLSGYTGDIVAEELVSGGDGGAHGVPEDQRYVSTLKSFTTTLSRAL